MRTVQRYLLFLLLPVLLFSAPPKRPVRRSVAPAPTGPASVIRDVSVVDVVTGQLIPHQDIAIRGDRIVSVTRTAPPGTVVRYAIPGLWDMHVHLWNANPQFPLFIASGVTGVRDMGSDLKRVRGWQAAIAKGELEGPRIYAGGSVVSSSPVSDPHLPVNIVHTPAEAVRIFDTYYDQHVDFIDILDLPANAFEALAEQSRHQGLPFAGHLPDSVSAFEAAQDRMVSMEHLFGIGLAVSSREPELRNAVLVARAQNDTAALAAANDDVMASWSTTRAAALWDLFRRYEVSQTPTLSMWLRRSSTDAAVEAGNPSLRLVAASVRKAWPEPRTAVDDSARRQYDFALRITAEMARAGVPILAGTDTGDPWTVPGATLHEELALLVEAGLSPAAALRTATLEPARLMHRQNLYGQLRPGFAADIVLLEANPLTDITNTRRIESVVLKGKQIGKPALVRMLADAAAAAGRT